MMRRLVLALLILLVVATPVYAAAVQIGLGPGGQVLNYGSSATGSQVCTLDDAGASNLATALDAPNGGITTQATPDAQGNCNGATFATLPTPTPGPSAHGLSAGAAAGTGATVSLVAGAGSNLQRGALQWTTGSAPSSGPQVVVAFGQPFAKPPYIDCFPRTAATAALQLYATGQTASGVTLAAAQAPAAATTYSCEYLVMP